ncbi:addiction module antidote protein [Sphingomonas sp. SRS2]|uniref:addiction module antidote protein n=1 Tax=Sphingomonas sp. SRS2 TaxID=133190 RepID=UPI000618419F|nr:addiction module antidote protein [Sphingomonas sp. SRS2]KKC24839.1 hypothetical protein WP12_16500 [Sphingomonas sp. SRS2]
MAITLENYDSAEHFTDPAAQDELIRDAIEQGDAGYLAHAIGIVLRANGMTKAQSDTGMKRQALYRAFSQAGNPTLDTFLKALKSAGLEITIKHATAA